MAQLGRGANPGPVNSQLSPAYPQQQPNRAQLSASTPQQPPAASTLPAASLNGAQAGNTPAVAAEPPKSLGFWERVFGGSSSEGLTCGGIL